MSMGTSIYPIEDSQFKFVDVCIFTCKVASSMVKYGAKGNCDIVEVRMEFKLSMNL
jgi:hypothetical protein